MLHPALFIKARSGLHISPSAKGVERLPGRRYQQARDLKCELDRITSEKSHLAPIVDWSTPAGLPATPATIIEAAEDKIDAPAIAILIIGILEFIQVLFFLFALIFPEVVPHTAVLMVYLLPCVLYGFFIIADSLKMRRLAAYELAVIASILNDRA